MVDDRERNQGMQQGGKDVNQQAGDQQAPGRNPQDDRAAGGQQGGQQQGGQKGDQGGGQKEGGQNEETRR